MKFNAGERCDIVIPVWDNLELTRECVDSIEKHTRFPYRLIIIDNASSTPTKEYLESLKKKDADKFAIIRNAENQGFVKAVNQGMRYSDGAYVCVMNNDTVATHRWLEEIISVLCQNPKIGLINPSSNSSCQFPGAPGVDAYAEKLRAFKGEYQELYTCRAFAMVVKREVIEKIGYLNEEYGMGYYDDTDYCKRAQKAHFLTARAKGSYVYHKESRSFSKVKEKSAIFRENEKKFNSKWGRQLRVAYVLPGPVVGKSSERISLNINRIAKSGHQVWVFMASGGLPGLDLIDHESIRLYRYPAFLFGATAFYKIWKRKIKKKLHLVLTQEASNCSLFKIFGKYLNAEIFEDTDFVEIEKKLEKLSRQVLK